MEIKIMNLDISINENAEYVINIKYGKIFDDIKAEEMQLLKNRMLEFKNKVVEFIKENCESEESK